LFFLEVNILFPIIFQRNFSPAVIALDEERPDEEE
jgi:hypothetical protein